MLRVLLIIFFYFYVSDAPLTRSRQTFHYAAAAELNQIAGGGDEALGPAVKALFCACTLSYAVSARWSVAKGREGRRRRLHNRRPIIRKTAMLFDFRLRFETTRMRAVHWLATANDRDTRSAALATCIEVGGTRKGGRKRGVAIYVHGKRGKAAAVPRISRRGNLV